MRKFLLLSLLCLTFSCGGEPPSKLTKENLQDSLCRPEHELKYYQDSEDSWFEGSWKWTCKRVNSVSQENSTYARVRVWEKGSRKRSRHSRRKTLRLDHSGRLHTERYEHTSRGAVYEFRRDSADDKWYVDTSNGKPVRRLWLFKRHIKIRPSKSAEPKKSKRFAKTKEPDKSPKTAETEKPAEVLELKKSVVVPKSEEMQELAEPSKNILAGNAEAAKSVMEQMRSEAAEDLITTLIEVADFRTGGAGIKSLEISKENVIISGSIECKNKMDGLRRLSQIRLKLEEYHEEVKLLEHRSTDKGLEFSLKLSDFPDFITCLASQETDQVWKEAEKAETENSAGQVWRVAEEERRVAEESYSQKDYVVAEKSYKQAEELYANVRKLVRTIPSEEQAGSKLRIVELQNSLAALESELRALQASGFPDKIVFKNGKETECEIISETLDSVRIRVKMGTADVPRTRIHSLVRIAQEKDEKASKLRSEPEIQEAQKEKEELGLAMAVLLADSVVDMEWANIKVKSVFDPTQAGNYVATIEVDKRKRWVKEADRFDGYEVLRIDGTSKCVAIIKLDSKKEKEFCTEE